MEDKFFTQVVFADFFQGLQFFSIDPSNRNKVVDNLEKIKEQTKRLQILNDFTVDEILEDKLESVDNEEAHDLHNADKSYRQLEPVWDIKADAA